MADSKKTDKVEEKKTGEKVDYGSAFERNDRTQVPYDDSALHDSLRELERRTKEGVSEAEKA